MIVRNYPITTDNVNNTGGKDMILSRMVNHYSALANAKSKIDNNTPFLGIKKTNHEKQKDLNKREEYRNVREAYKKVSTVKPYVDSNKPFTYDKKLKNCYKSIKEKYDNTEHIRTLAAMSKRILSIGKMHERKKNKFDPIANPTYFFRNIQSKSNPNDEAIKLISLQNLNEKLKNLNENEKNKLLLGNTIYNAINSDNKSKNRPKSAIQTKNKNLDNNKEIPMFVEYDPEKYIKIHQLNRENDGEKILKKHKQELEQKNKTKSSTISSKSKSIKKSVFINNNITKDIPRYKENEIISLAEDQFKNDIKQFIIKNNISSNEDFDILIKELIKKNNDKKIKPIQIRKILQDAKQFLN